MAENCMMEVSYLPEGNVKDPVPGGVQADWTTLTNTHDTSIAYHPHKHSIITIPHTLIT